MDKKLHELVGTNIGKPRLKVKHADLKRLENDSMHKSICPECNEGFLLMIRDPETYTLRNYDACILCGQQFEYTDIPDKQLSFLNY